MKNKYEKDKSYDLFLNDLEPDINKVLRLIEIDKDLIRLIEHTNNKVFHRKLFFPFIFINNEFKFEDYTIKGILVQECLCEKGRSNKFIANSRIGEKIFLPENKKFHPSHNSLIKRKMSNKFNLEEVKDF